MEQCYLLQDLSELTQKKAELPATPFIAVLGKLRRMFKVLPPDF